MQKPLASENYDAAYREAEASKMGDHDMSPLNVGRKVFICTVTRYYTGRIAYLDEQQIVLLDAAWIPDTGRYAECIRNGTFAEVEPIIDAVTSVMRSAVVEVTEWKHDLPREIK